MRFRETLNIAFGDLALHKFRSALATLALRASGYDARNYAGSWHEWSRHDELPLER